MVRLEVSFALEARVKVRFAVTNNFFFWFFFGFFSFLLRRIFFVLDVFLGIALSLGDKITQKQRVLVKQ